MINLNEIRSDNRQEELYQFLQAHYVGSLTGATAQLTVVFFSVLDGRLVIKSRVGSRHSKALAVAPACALTVYDHSSSYSSKYGVQIEGDYVRIEEAAHLQRAVDSYDAAFAGAAAKINALDDLIGEHAVSGFYEFVPKRFKIIDESPAGNRTMSDFSDVA